MSLLSKISTRLRLSLPKIVNNTLLAFGQQYYWHITPGYKHVICNNYLKKPFKISYLGGQLEMLVCKTRTRVQYAIS